MELPVPYEAALQAIQEARRQMNIPPPADPELWRAWATFQRQLFDCEKKVCWFGFRERDWEKRHRLIVVESAG